MIRYIIYYYYCDVTLVFLNYKKLKRCLSLMPFWYDEYLSLVMDAVFCLRL